jgi:type II secretion system protein G
MLEKLRQRSSEESGFTLVELLVVMLILGILAAIAIPTFFNQRDKAKDASAKEAVRTAQTAMETYGTDNNGTYTGATAAKLDAIESTLDASKLTVTVGGSTGVAYVLKYNSDVSGHWFQITKNTDGSTTFQCAVEGEGGCPTGQNWGGTSTPTTTTP